MAEAIGPHPAYDDGTNQGDAPAPPPAKTPGSESIAMPPIRFESQCHGFEPPQRHERPADLDYVLVRIEALSNRLRNVERRLAEIHPTQEGPE